jgi:phage terminase large subunit
MICHRRAGKTTACLMDMVDHAIKTQKGRYAYIAPLRNQAKTVAWDMLKGYVRPVIKGGPNEAELRVDLINDSRITLFGADNPDALRGQAFNGVVLDEYADMPPSLLPVIVRPALTDRRGFAIIVGTVKGRNQLWQLYDAVREDDSWYTTLLKASETHILPQEELEDAKRQMAPEQYDSEFECDPYAAILGAYYGTYMADAEKDERIRPGSLHDDALPVFTAWDLGIGASSMAIWFWQVAGNEIRIIDYYENHGKGFDFYVSELGTRPYRYDFDFVPHDARVKELGTGKTRIETLMSLGRKPMLVVDHKVEDGINATRLILPKCHFDADKCKDGLEALRQYRSDYDERKRIYTSSPRKDWTSHAADAFRYLAMAYTEMKPKEIIDKPKGFFVPLDDLSIEEYELFGKSKKGELV